MDPSLMVLSTGMYCSLSYVVTEDTEVPIQVIYVSSTILLPSPSNVVFISVSIVEHSVSVTQLVFISDHNQRPFVLIVCCALTVSRVILQCSNRLNAMVYVSPCYARQAGSLYKI